MKMSNGTMEVLTSGKKVVLRDSLPADMDTHIRWLNHGEWRRYDAPWERPASMTADEISTKRKKFLETCMQELPMPRNRATIATLENKPLGWVNRYADQRRPEAWFVGIDMCEDDYLNRGYGAEALGLWIQHLFTNSEIHRIGLDTWSFNPRMMHVAEKVGFVYEGAQRELIAWQGQRLDLVHYGMLRREWEKIIVRASA